MSSAIYMVDVHFGAVEVQSRWVTAADGWIESESRAIYRDRRGNIERITPWQPLGARMHLSRPEPARRAWWKFWV